MSIKTAMAFIEQAGRNRGIKRRIKALGIDLSLEEIAAIGAEEGYRFTAEHLRMAFKQDWRMRRMYYAKARSD